MQCLVKSTIGNGKQRYDTHTERACFVNRTKQGNDILVLYPENIKAKQSNFTLNLTKFCSLIHPRPIQTKINL